MLWSGLTCFPFYVLLTPFRVKGITSVVQIHDFCSRHQHLLFFIISLLESFRKQQDGKLQRKQDSTNQKLKEKGEWHGVNTEPSACIRRSAVRGCCSDKRALCPDAVMVPLLFSPAVVSWCVIQHCCNPRVLDSSHVDRQ